MLISQTLRGVSEKREEHIATVTENGQGMNEMSDLGRDARGLENTHRGDGYSLQRPVLHFAKVLAGAANLRETRQGYVQGPRSC
jgi:hypothetical protein